MWNPVSKWEEWEKTRTFLSFSFSLCLFHSTLVFLKKRDPEVLPQKINQCDRLVRFFQCITFFYSFHTEFSIQSINSPFFVYALSLFVKNTNRQSQMLMNQYNLDLNTAFRLWTLAQIVLPLAPQSREAWQMIAQLLRGNITGYYATFLIIVIIFIIHNIGSCAWRLSTSSSSAD